MYYTLQKEVIFLKFRGVLGLNDIKFFKSFRFYLFRHRQYHHTDMTSGSPYHYLAQMVNGSGKIVADGITLNLNKGDVFYIPKGLCYHSHWYPENESVAFYSFGFEFFPLRSSSFKLQKIELTHGETALFDALKENLIRSPQTVGRLYYLLGEISPRLLTDKRITCKTVNTALEFMRNNPQSSIKEVAEFCDISESGLYIKFKKYLSKTPVTIKQEILTDKAKELLSNTDLPIEQISDSLGFSSSSYFRKIFYQKTQKTPTAYRKESRNI